MKLFELFQAIADYQLTADTPNKLLVKAKIGGRTISFWGSKRSNDIWEIDFSEEREGGPSTMKATGSGSATQVFSFILKMMKLLEKKYPNLKGFKFTASGTSRIELYKALLNRYAKGYHVETKHIGDGVYFNLTRKA